MRGQGSYTDCDDQNVMNCSHTHTQVYITYQASDFVGELRRYTPYLYETTNQKFARKFERPTFNVVNSVT